MISEVSITPEDKGGMYIRSVWRRLSVDAARYFTNTGSAKFSLFSSFSPNERQDCINPFAIFSHLLTMSSFSHSDLSNHSINQSKNPLSVRVTFTRLSP